MPGKSAFCLPRVTPGCNLPSGKIHWLRKCDDYIVLMSHIHDNANSTHILSCARHSRKKNVFWHNGNKTQVVGFLIVAAVVSFGDRRERLEGYFHMQDLNVLLSEWGELYSIFPEMPDTHVALSHLTISYHPLPSLFNHFRWGAVSCQALNASWPHHKRDNAAPPLQHVWCAKCAMF